MTSPFSAPVLGSGALLASPALYAAFVDGTMSADTAIVRLLVAVLVSWIGFSLLASLLTGTAEAPTAPGTAPSPVTGESPRAVEGVVASGPDHD
jgi:hypothetical protein